MGQVATSKRQTAEGSEPELEQAVDRDRSRLLGARLQELRRMRGLSLKQVADEAGMSSSFLSMVERGQTDLSLTRFSRLTEFFDVQPSELLMELNAQFSPPTFERLESFRTIPRGAGVEFYVLQDNNPQMIFVKMAPGSRFTDPRSHRGSDFWFVLEGEPVLHYGSETYELGQGDTARFPSTLPHGLANPGSSPAALMALCSVPYW
jgi:transcriptional regulator with XRE-family HTH domain